MPPKRDYGPPTRRSQRLTTVLEELQEITQVDDHKEEAIAVTVVIAEGTKPEQLAHLALSDNREQDTLLPSIEEDNESEEYDSVTENNNLEEAVDYLLLE